MEYKICSKTIMDTSDPNIVFNKNGESDYYTNFHQNIKLDWEKDISNKNKLIELAKSIKKNSKPENDFDCIIGLSGGLDSSYLAHVATKIMGLKPLLLHVDAGWNTEQAVSNIEKLVKGLNLDLYTEVINWEQMKNIQRAFLKSQISDQDLPQDAAFFSSLYKFAIKDILTKYGDRKIGCFPLVDILKYKVWDRYINGMKVIKPLNLVKFNKIQAEKLLNDNYDWKSYKHKHHESRFTRFYEDYWLPQKFGYEKRRAHFSSLILTGQMKREDALKRISKPECNQEFLEKEFKYVADKLDFTHKELRDIFKSKNSNFNNYRNKKHLIDLGAKVLKLIGNEKRLFR